jgi:DNA-binding NtrC family response regulator
MPSQRNASFPGGGHQALACLRVLVVDGEPAIRLDLRRLIESLGAEVREANTGREALDTLSSWTPHLILTEILVGDVSGLDLLTYVRRHQLATKVLVITGHATVAFAVEAMRCGAQHFFTKPFDSGEVLREIEKHGNQLLISEKELHQQHVIGGSPEAPIITKDRSMISLLALVRQVAPTNMPVLIRGESGTGKELIARAIHEGSNDPSLPFLPVNSAALPDTLLESELFGHVKGAFTGAVNNREGIFAMARGGTVFLDEIALMSPAFQCKLLRVLQEQTVVPLGSSTARPVAFRLVAATNRSLRKRIEAGKFREDLYFRLRVVTINIPPLRERPDDILPLAVHFLDKYSEEVGLAPGCRPYLSIGAAEMLQRHRWPGNVRELENCIQRALILCRGESVDASHLNLDEESYPWASESSACLSYEEGKKKALATYQRKTVERALRSTQGNVSRAAESCGLSRAAFQRIMRSRGLDRQLFARA